MTKDEENKGSEDENEQVRFSVEDAQSILQEEAQRNIEAGGAEIQEVLDRRGLRISISMLLLDDGRNIPNITLTPRETKPARQ